MASRIIGCGGYLPNKVVTNRDIEGILNTSDEWITSRTGIKQRHIADDEENVSDMGFEASKRALENAKINKDQIDLVIVCTNTGDRTFPSVANKIHALLGLRSVPSFDMQAICSGFVYGIHVADNMLKSGAYKTILLIASDKMSSILDWQDRRTSILFGDGAGAVILQRDDSKYGIIDSKIYSNGSDYDILHTTGGIGSTKTAGVISMKGAEVYKRAVDKMFRSVSDILKNNQLDVEDIDFLVPHQANIRIIDAIASKFGIAYEKVSRTVEFHANCSAASIPLALSELTTKNRIKEGNNVVFTSFGAGTTWGATLVSW